MVCMVFFFKWDLLKNNNISWILNGITLIYIRDFEWDVTQKPIRTSLSNGIGHYPPAIGTQAKESREKSSDFDDRRVIGLIHSQMSFLAPSQLKKHV